LSRAEGIRDAVPYVIVEDRHRDALECSGDGTELRQDVDAIAVVFDHALDPAHLPFDPVQALRE
jgi:hypothetical protein